MLDFAPFYDPSLGKRDLNDYEPIEFLIKNTKEFNKTIMFQDVYEKVQQDEYFKSEEFRKLILQKKQEEQLQNDPKEKIKAKIKLEQMKRKKRVKKKKK